MCVCNRVVGQGTWEARAAHIFRLIDAAGDSNGRIDEGELQVALMHKIDIVQKVQKVQKV